jgi:hypothetical protein
VANSRSIRLVVFRTVKPGTRVTFKYQKGFGYGTVIPGQFRNNDGLIFVVWDKKQGQFTAYSCNEVRKTRKNEEEQYPEKGK